MRGRFVIGAVLLSVVAACGPGGEVIQSSSLSSSAPPPPPTTTVTTDSSPTTTTAAAPASPLRYFRFGDDGLFLVDGSGETRLDVDRVTTASYDGMGGVLYTTFEEWWENGLKWAKAAATEPETLDYLRGWAAVLDGRPMLIAEKGTWHEDCPDTMYQALLVDLTTGDESAFGCFGGEDGGMSVVSGGGGLVVGTRWLAVGANGTDLDIHFYDTTGNEIDHPFNPVPESCAPCELDVRLSPDGSWLAYRLRPDAKWATDLEESQRIDLLTYHEWWETSRDIPGAVVVLDLGGGDELFRMEVAAGERLVDFDGRRLVTESCELVPLADHRGDMMCMSHIVDTQGASPQVAVPGRVRLATRVWGDPPAVDLFPPLLRVWSPVEGQVVGTRSFTFEGVADPEARVVAAGRYPVSVTPHGTWSIDLVLNPGGNLATITATDDAGNVSTVRRSVTYLTEVVLRHDGLGGWSFGDPADDVIAAVTELLGQPDRVELEDGSDCYRSVRQAQFVTWDDAGLRLVFTDWGGTDETPVAAPLHFTDWEVFGPGVMMETGLGWGSTVGDLKRIHPDVSIGINEFAAMFFAPVPGGWLMGDFDWPYEDFMASLQRALNEHGADIPITGEWSGGVTETLFDFMDEMGIDAHEVLGALALPPDRVRLASIYAGTGPLCD